MSRETVSLDKKKALQEKKHACTPEHVFCLTTSAYLIEEENISLRRR
jgi:hypothetical protein